MFFSVTSISWTFDIILTFVSQVPFPVLLPLLGQGPGLHTLTGAHTLGWAAQDFARCFVGTRDHEQQGRRSTRSTWGGSEDGTHSLTLTRQRHYC